MCHALIIHDNRIISHAIQAYLEELGFTSFDETWTEAQAVAAARRTPPDLVVIGDSLEAGSPLIAAKRIFAKVDVPILMVTGDPVQARRCLDQVAAFEGPFLLNAFDEAIRIARGEDAAPRRGPGTPAVSVL